MTEAIAGAQVDPKGLEDLSKLEDLLADGEFALDGEKVSLEEIRRFRDTRKNVEADYTRKTQGLADEKKQLQEQLGNLQPYFELQEFFSKNPDKAAKVSQLMNEGDLPPVTPVQPGQQPQGQSTEIQALKGQVSQLQKTVTGKMENDKFEKDVQDEQKFVQSTIESLKEKYPNMNQDIVVAKLMSLPNVEQLSREQYGETIEYFSKESHDGELAKEQQIIHNYLDKKKNPTKTEGVGETLQIKKNQKPADLMSGDARRQATEYLKTSFEQET